MPETYIVAKNSGDQEFLGWIHDRLEIVHREDRYIDYMWTLRAYKAYFYRRAEVPKWLNWLLRKYSL